MKKQIRLKAQVSDNKYITSKGVEVLRTPEHLFDEIDYPFTPHYVFIDEIRMHYVDENSESDKVIVLLHGQPTWGYLYRNIIPLLVAAGYRVIVPDLIGFGKSDKPSRKKTYSYAKNVEWMTTFLFDTLKLDQINFGLHDWGGVIGLRIVAAHPEKFKSVIAINTAFPRLEGINPVFCLYRSLIELLVFIPSSVLIRLNIKAANQPQVFKGYDVPFCEYKYRTAPRAFPKLVPIFPWQKETNKNKMAWKKLCEFDRPFVTLFSDKDPFTKRVEEDFIREIAGARNQPHEKIKNLGHFIQEEDPELVANFIIRFLANQVYS